MHTLRRLFQWVLLSIALIIGISAITPANAKDYQNHILLYGPKAQDDHLVGQEFDNDTYRYHSLTLISSLDDPATLHQLNQSVTDSTLEETLYFMDQMAPEYNRMANGLVTQAQYTTSVPDDKDGYAVARENLSGYLLTKAGLAQLPTAPVLTLPNVDPATTMFRYAITPATKTDLKQVVTIQDADERPLEQRTVTGILGYQGQMLLDATTYDATQDQLVDSAGKRLAVTPDAVYTPQQSFSFKLTDQPTATYTVIPKDYLTSLVHYRYADGRTAAPDKLVYGLPTDTLTVDALKLDGYVADQPQVTVTPGQDATITYTAKEQPVTPPTTPTTPSEPATPETPETPTEPTPPTTSPSFQPFKVYVKRGLYTYQHATFKSGERIKHYRQLPREQAQTFTVVGTATSTQGRLRYHLSNGAYVTANPNYVANLYWQGNTYTKLKVTNAKGAYQYRSTTLAKKHRGKFLKKGTTVKVTKLVRRGTMTRYQLANGQYLTGNKQFVSMIK